MKERPPNPISPRKVDQARSSPVPPLSTTRNAGPPKDLPGQGNAGPGSASHQSTSRTAAALPPLARQRPGPGPHLPGTTSGGGAPFRISIPRDSATVCFSGEVPTNGGATLPRGEETFDMRLSSAIWPISFQKGAGPQAAATTACLQPTGKRPPANKGQDRLFPSTTQTNQSAPPVHHGRFKNRTEASETMKPDAFFHVLGAGPTIARHNDHRPCRKALEDSGPDPARKIG